ncbi:hypothetical protein GOBAR_AA21418 [Gossypium barbadense]|uniref:Premnaspirodiene oxygenase-like n=1 Tax=Gossypium barbadense TaxID=3634 RepID=A0A2P5X7D7_GOSBA|nr:hypothetical protein GOBAR_AA21418 [Gossypium barbadense]
MDNQFKMLPLCFTFLVFIFLVLKLWMRSKIKDSPKNLPPAPWKLPLIGHLHLLMFSLPHHRLTELAKRHGSLMHLQLGELSHIVVSSPEAAKEVMKTHDISFATRPYLLGAEIIAYNFSDIGFAPYGDYWRQLRKVCTLELLSMKRVQSFRSIREEQVSCLIRSIYSNTGLEINLREMLCNSSYNITLRTAFAARCKQHAAFISIARKLVEAASGFSTTDLFPSVKLLPMISGMRAKLERWHHDLDAMLETIIEEHRAGNANPKDSDDVTDDLVDLSRTSFQDMLIAGTETSSTAVEWAMSELIKNPRILGKAQAEVRQVYDRTGDVNESDLHELKYLKLVMKETLRLHPPLPFLLPRESRKRCEINRYEIPAKTKVIVNAWAIGRDSNYWNEAERFYPERFIDSSVEYKGTNFEFIPFGAGRRICPGISMLPNGLKNEDLDMTETFGATSRRKRDLRLIPIPYHPPSSIQ